MECGRNRDFWNNDDKYGMNLCRHGDEDSEWWRQRLVASSLWILLVEKDSRGEEIWEGH